MVDKIKDILKRHIYYIILGLISLYLLYSPLQISTLSTIFTIVVFECVAIALSSIAVFAYTKIDFIKRATAGDDKEYSVIERAANTITIGIIFFAVHVLIAISVHGTYFVTFAPGIGK